METGAGPSQSRHRAAVVHACVLVLAAITLYLPLIGWGLPHATAPDRIKTLATDEILPLEGLAEIRSTFSTPAADRNLGYPWFHYAVVSAAQAPYLAWLWVTGDLTAPVATYPFGLAEPVYALKVLTIVGRLVSVLMAAGIVVAAFVFARTFWGDSAGLAAAILTLLSYPMTYYARTGNLDVPAFFWTACGMAALAQLLVRGATRGRALALAICAALAVATKDQAVLFFLPALGMLASLRTDGHAGQLSRSRLLLVVGVAGLSTYIIATGMVFDPARHIEHVSRLLFQPRRLSRSVMYYPPAPLTWTGTWQLLLDYGRALAAVMSWPVLLVGAAGAIIAIRDRRVHIWWLVPFATTFLVLIRLPGIVVLRYLLPLTLFVDGFAALALLRVKRVHPVAFWLLFGVLAAGRLAIGIDLSVAQWHETRSDAARWLAAHRRAGDAVGYFGVSDVLPPLDAEMTAIRLAGGQGARQSQQADPLDALARSGPRFVVIVPDWTNRDGEYSADCPPEVYSALMQGTAGYTLAAYFPSRTILPTWFRRPRLDNPSVSPPVRIFMRQAS